LKAKDKRTGYLRTAMVGLAIFLPALSLMPLGSLWLWQNGYLLYWVGGALVVSLSSYFLELWLVRGSHAPAAGPSPQTDAELTWTPREAAAWAEVDALAKTTDPTLLVTRAAILDLGMRTVETVARNIHPDDRDPLWRFTVPEVLTLIERVSRDLRPFVANNIPLGDQLTVGQVIKVYRWRGALDVAEKAYDLWRIVRMLNPVTAVANEAREKLSKKLYTGVRDQVAQRLVEGYVREIGRAAIDLYGGRLRVTTDELAEHVTPASQRDLADVQTAEPLRILIAGQGGVGKSSLINAMAREVSAAVDVLPATFGYTAYRLKASLGLVLLIDSPAIKADASSLKSLVAQADASDIVVWVAAANRADRDVDRKALDAVKAHFRKAIDRRPPPVFAVVSHVDLLRPSRDWAPPYDFANAVGDKEVSIKAAMDAIRTDLELQGVNIIPISLRQDLTAFNVDAVWGAINDVLSDAQRARSVRSLRSAAPGWSLKKLWTQAYNAGTIVKGTKFWK
jgi:uncharacterized protein